ncbi:hypothetical protein H7171_02415 [Candidatus Saccharibacteria bacterium]|nr:hypothetical protein [Candidatus Saccharibacteria bacterium]
MKSLETLQFDQKVLVLGAAIGAILLVPAGMVAVNAEHSSSTVNCEVNNDSALPDMQRTIAQTESGASAIPKLSGDVAVFHISSGVCSMINGYELPK